MNITASAIVRNEADRYLDIWLRHLLTFCDEVRLLDDGSTDATREIAAQYSEVALRPNRGVPFMENESAARNALLEWTIAGRPDYVLSIDADEFIGDTHAIHEAVKSEQAVYSLWMREVWQVGTVDPGGMSAVGLRVDGQWGDRRVPILWRAPMMWRGSRWKIPNRKLASGREPQGVRGQRGVDTGVGVYHFGWTRVAEREARADRYYQHDGGRFHAPAHLQSLLDPDEAVTIDWQPWPTSIPGAAVERALRP